MAVRGSALLLITQQSFTFPDSRNIHPVILKDGDKLTADRVREELQGIEGDVWLAGSNELMAEFMEMNLIDEVTLLVLPVTLGKGLPLTSRSNAENGWELASMEKYDNGVVKTTYVRPR